MAEPHVLLGVTGGIAAYKVPDVASRLVRAGVTVDVVMTEAATRFVAPLSFASLVHRPVHTGLWERHPVEPHHIALAERPDLVVLAPATANTLAKAARGIADNLLTCVLLATRAPVLAAPAMNDGMWSHPATRANLDLLRERGMQLVGPAEGRLASGKSGTGRMSPPEEIAERALELLRDGGGSSAF